MEMYAVLMLILLKPWRTAADLLDKASTWTEAFDKWKATLTDTDWAVQQMKRFELLHTCAAEKEMDKKQMIANMQRMLEEHMKNPALQKTERPPKKKQQDGDIDMGDADEMMGGDWTEDADMSELQQNWPEVR
jgi:hypothetical protein